MIYITKKQMQQGNKEIVKYLLAIGAKPFKSINEWQKTYLLETKAGELFITLDNEEKQRIISLYCKFKNEKAATELIPNSQRLNQYSGKFNFNAYSTNQLISELKYDLLPVLKQ